MNYILYGSRGSGSLAIELALSEAGVPFRVEDTSIEGAAQRSEWFSAINPQRKVPALLTPQGETLTESAAILLSLDERHREAALLPPAGTPERAQALRWLLFISSEIYPLIEVIDYPERFEASPGTADATRALAKAKWRDRWLLLERAIAGAPWLLSGGFCLVDLYIAVISRWPSGDKEYRAEWLPTRAPRVEALARAVAERTACKAVWQGHFPSPSAPPAASELEPPATRASPPTAASPPPAASPATRASPPEGLPFHILDVFTTGRPMSGNQLLVVEDRNDTLSTEAMQQIAAEIGFAESAFVRSPTGGCAATVRIFTTDAEVPQAGHPIIGLSEVVGSGVDASEFAMMTNKGRAASGGGGDCERRPLHTPQA